jgi:hypothetical protein
MEKCKKNSPSHLLYYVLKGFLKAIQIERVKEGVLGHIMVSQTQWGLC